MKEPRLFSLLFPSFGFFVCQLVRIIFLFFCNYFFLSKKKRKKYIEWNRLLYSLWLNHTIDKLVGFYEEVDENVHEKEKRCFFVVSFVWIPLSSLFVFFVCQLVRIIFLFLCKYFFLFQRRKEIIYRVESRL
jgi:hypothetical protein